MQMSDDIIIPGRMRKLNVLQLSRLDRACHQRPSSSTAHALQQVCAFLAPNMEVM